MKLAEISETVWQANATGHTIFDRLSWHGNACTCTSRINAVGDILRIYVRTYRLVDRKVGRATSTK